MIKVILYTRVSTQEQANEGYSIGEQNARLTKYCEAMGWTVINTYTDGGYSGATTDRPALKKLIKDVQNGKADKVVVYKLDRLSRSQKDTLYLIEDIFLANKTDFVSMNENFDTSTPFGRAMIGILAVFAQLEREQIKERMTMGKDARAKEGKWNGGGYVPTGYDYVDGELVVNDFHALQVQELFKRFIQGEPIATIEKSFERRGYTRTNTRYMLNNKVYTGYIRHRNSWIRGQHDPIIDDETFERAQLLLNERRERYESKGYKTNVRTSHLGGLIFCKHCGGLYSRVQSGRPNFNVFHNYTCYSRHKKNRNMIKDPNCKNKTYRVNELDEIIFNEIRKLELDPNYLKSVRDEMPDNTEKIDTIKTEIDNIDNQISRFMDLYGIGKFDIKQLDAKVAPLEARKIKLYDSLQDIEVFEPRMTDSEVIESVRSFADAIERGTMQEVRIIIEDLIKCIVIDNESITIQWNFL